MRALRAIGAERERNERGGRLGGARRSRALRRAAVAALAALAVPLLGPECGDAPVALRAGACAVDITPVVGVNHSDPIFLAGFNNDHHATGVHDPLWARGLVLETPTTKIAFVTLDVVGYFYNEVQTIRSLVDPALGFDAITVTSTHNHEGPDTMGLWGPDEFTSGTDLDYLDFVNDSVVDCIEAANASLEPAALKTATGTTAGTSLPPWPDLVADGEVLRELVVDPSLEGFPGPPITVLGDDGPILNTSLPTLQLRRWFPNGEGPERRKLGHVIATLVNFASHPESLGASNTILTSDFPHFTRQRLEAEYGGVAIFVSGDLGVLQGPLDVDLLDPATEQPVPRRTFAFAERMGVLLAERAIEALEATEAWDPKPPVQVRAHPALVIQVENPFFVALGNLGVFGRRPLLKLDGAFVVETETQAVRIGNAQIAVTPNELDPQIGDHYRALMSRADHRFVFGLGNDEIGYQMPEAKFNPSCFLCFTHVLFGDPANCGLASTLDCGTVFINNIGPGADPVLQDSLEGLIADLNP